MKTRVKPSAQKKGGKTSSAISGAGVFSSDRLIVYSYFIACALPSFGAIDSMGAHWLFIAVLNVISAAYLYKNRLKTDLTFLKTLPALSFIAFIFLGALSFFAAFNVSESLVTYSRLLISFMAFVSFGALVSARRRLVDEAFALLAAFCIFDALVVYKELIANLSVYNGMNDVIYHIRGNTGNKNILAASIAVKLPILILFILEKKGTARYFYAVALAICVSAIALLNARASYLGAIIGFFVFAVPLLILNFRTHRFASSIKNLSLAVIMFVSGILLSEVVFRVASQGRNMQYYTSATERFSSIGATNEASSGRIQYWGFAIDFISRHPLLGGGYGNWNIHEVPYENHFRNGFGSAKHVHNDFLEVTADTGIPGGAVYLLIFGTLGIFLLKRIKRTSQEPTETTSILTLAALLITYTVDAFFNFPLERPNMQILFAFTAASIVATGHGYTGTKRFSQGLQRNLMILFLLLGLMTTTVSYKVFKSFRFQAIIADDWDGGASTSAKAITSYDVLKGLPDFPNINELNGIPITCVKAKYLAQEKKYEEALRLLDAGKSANPHHYYAEFIRSKIYQELGNKDSAMYYARIAFENRPSNLQLFQHYNGLLASSSDSTEVRRTYYEFRKWNRNPQGCHAFVLNIYFCTRNLESFMGDLEAAFRKAPADSTLHFDYAFYRGGSYQNQGLYEDAVKSYQEALPFNSSDEFCRSNLAYCLLYLKEYSRALPLYDSLIEDFPAAGKYYNYRGMCYFNLKEKSRACSDVEMALRNGFQVPEDMQSACRN